MFSGLTPAFHGASKWTNLDPSIEVLPQILDRMGYETHAVVSAPYLAPSFGLARGFDSYLTRFGSRADEIVNAAIDRLDLSQGANRFLFVHIFDPHWPYVPPERFRDRFGPPPSDISALIDKIKAEERPKSDVEISELMKLYDAEIAHADEQIGRLIDELDRRDLYRNALVIVTADHGEAFFDHGHWQHSRSLYEELLHVPLIVKWPGNQPRGRAPSIASHVDILPTILAETGSKSKVGEEVSGIDLKELVGRTTSSRTAVSESVWFLSEGIRARFSFRTLEYRYIASLLADRVDELAIDRIESEELYSVADSREERNLAASEADRTRRFREALADYLEGVRGRRDGGRRVLDEATEERLRSLGYVY
jgi:arylsulfatase A-like enzyme